MTSTDGLLSFDRRLERAVLTRSHRQQDGEPYKESFLSLVYSKQFPTMSVLMHELTGIVYHRDS